MPRRLAYALAADAVHLYRLEVPGPKEVDRLFAVLSRDELDRAGTFSFEEHARRFAFCRAAMRVLLGRYLEAEPASLRFRYGAMGRPELRGGRIRFSLSHAGEGALLALAREADVGVDLEDVRRKVDWQRMARRWLAPGELSAIARRPWRERRAAFFEMWVRKEAYLKATGQGLSVELQALDTFALPRGWSVLPVELGKHLAAAVAVAITRPRLSLRELGPDLLEPVGAAIPA